MNSKIIRALVASAAVLAAAGPLHAADRTDDAIRSGEQLADRTERTTERTTERATERAADRTERATERAAERSERAAERAERATDRTADRVEHRTSSSERYLDDAAITASIKTKQAEDKTVRATAIGVETKDGVVQLSGFTPSAAEKARAEEIARSVKGVKSIRNDIVVRP